MQAAQHLREQLHRRVRSAICTYIRAKRSGQSTENPNQLLKDETVILPDVAISKSANITAMR